MEPGGYHVPRCNVSVKNTWSYTSTPPCVSISWCLVKHGDKLTLRSLAPVGLHSLISLPFCTFVFPFPVFVSYLMPGLSCLLSFFAAVFAFPFPFFLSRCPITPFLCSSVLHLWRNPSEGSAVRHTRRMNCMSASRTWRMPKDETITVQPLRRNLHGLMFMAARACILTVSRSRYCFVKQETVACFLCCFLLNLFVLRWAINIFADPSGRAI